MVDGISTGSIQTSEGVVRADSDAGVAFLAEQAAWLKRYDRARDLAGPRATQLAEGIWSGARLRLTAAEFGGIERTCADSLRAAIVNALDEGAKSAEVTP